MVNKLEWISVEDRIPPIDVDVLTFDELGDIQMAYLETDRKSWFQTHGGNQINVMYWVEPFYPPEYHVVDSMDFLNGRDYFNMFCPICNKCHLVYGTVEKNRFIRYCRDTDICYYLGKEIDDFTK